MKFRSIRRQVIADPEPFEDEFLETAMTEPARSKWSTAFLIAGSALMGATALALWNRRTITSMRAQIEAMSSLAATPAVKKEEEIF